MYGAYSLVPVTKRIFHNERQMFERIFFRNLVVDGTVYLNEVSEAQQREDLLARARGRRSAIKDVGIEDVCETDVIIVAREGWRFEFKFEHLVVY